MKCEGNRRAPSSFMTLGPRPTWVQCSNDAIVILKGTQKEESSPKAFELPACRTCWEEAMQYEGMEIESALAIEEDLDA